MDWVESVVGCASMASKGEVQDQIESEVLLVRLEGIAAVALPALVSGLPEFNGIQKFIIDIDLEILGCPIESPYMKLLRPIRIFLLEMLDGYISFVPLAVILFCTAPAGIGQDTRFTVLDVIFHNVNLAAFRPLVLIAQQPDSRP